MKHRHTAAETRYSQAEEDLKVAYRKQRQQNITELSRP